MSEIHFNDNSPINRAIKLIDQKAGYGLGTVVETGEAVYVQPTREQWNRKLLEMGFKTEDEMSPGRRLSPRATARRAGLEIGFGAVSCMPLLQPSCFGWSRLAEEAQEAASSATSRAATQGTADMAPHLVALTGFIYLWVAIEQLRAGDRPMALAFVAYLLANVGFVWQALKGKPWTTRLSGWVT